MPSMYPTEIQTILGKGFPEETKLLQFAFSDIEFGPVFSTAFSGEKEDIDSTAIDSDSNIDGSLFTNQNSSKLRVEAKNAEDFNRIRAELFAEHTLPRFITELTLPHLIRIITYVRMNRSSLEAWLALDDSPRSKDFEAICYFQKHCSEFQLSASELSQFDNFKTTLSQTLSQAGASLSEELMFGIFRNVFIPEVTIPLSPFQTVSCNFFDMSARATFPSFSVASSCRPVENIVVLIGEKKIPHLLSTTGRKKDSSILNLFGRISVERRTSTSIEIRCTSELLLFITFDETHGNISRFLMQDPNPNCTLRLELCGDGLPSIVVVARSDINTGDLLTVNWPQSLSIVDPALNAMSLDERNEQGLETSGGKTVDEVETFPQSGTVQPKMDVRKSAEDEISVESEMSVDGQNEQGFKETSAVQSIETIAVDVIISPVTSAETTVVVETSAVQSNETMAVVETSVDVVISPVTSAKTTVDVETCPQLQTNETMDVDKSAEDEISLQTIGLALKEKDLFYTTHEADGWSMAVNLVQPNKYRHNKTNGGGSTPVIFLRSTLHTVFNTKTSTEDRANLLCERLIGSNLCLFSLILPMSEKDLLSGGGNITGDGGCGFRAEDAAYQLWAEMKHGGTYHTDKLDRNFNVESAREEFGVNMASWVNQLKRVIDNSQTPSNIAVFLNSVVQDIEAFQVWVGKSFPHTNSSEPFYDDVWLKLGAFYLHEMTHDDPPVAVFTTLEEIYIFYESTKEMLARAFAGQSFVFGSPVPFHHFMNQIFLSYGSRHFSLFTPQIPCPLDREVCEKMVKKLCLSYVTHVEEYIAARLPEQTLQRLLRIANVWAETELEEDVGHAKYLEFEIPLSQQDEESMCCTEGSCSKLILRKCFANSNSFFSRS